MNSGNIIHLHGESLLPESISMKAIVRVEWTSQEMLIVTKDDFFLVTGDNLLLILYDIVFEDEDLYLPRRTESPLGSPDWTVTDIKHAKSERDLREGGLLSPIPVDEFPKQYFIFEMGRRTVLHWHSNLIAVGVLSLRKFWFRIDELVYLAELQSDGKLENMGQFTADCFSASHDVIITVNPPAVSKIEPEPAQRLLVSKIERELASNNSSSLHKRSMSVNYAKGKGPDDLKPKQEPPKGPSGIDID